MDKTLQNLALKLGLNSTATQRKAEELSRLVAVQGGGRLSLSVSARAIICLDIAAGITEATIDKKQAVRLSGLTRPQYVALSQTVTRLLNLTPRVTVSDLCVTHSATSATQLAQQVLKQYEESVRGASEVDTTLPLYQVAAVIASTKVLKVKVDKRRLFESSGSKRAVFQRLVEAMTKIAQDIYSNKGVKLSSKRSRTLMDLVEDNLRNASSEKCRKVERDGEEGGEGDGKDDDFDAWKKKMLEAAAGSI